MSHDSLGLGCPPLQLPVPVWAEELGSILSVVCSFIQQIYVGYLLCQVLF